MNPLAFQSVVMIMGPNLMVGSEEQMKTVGILAVYLV